MAPDGRREIDINQKWSAMNKLKYSPIFAPLLPLNLHIRAGKQIKLDSFTPFTPEINMCTLRVLCKDMCSRALGFAPDDTGIL